MCDKTTRPSTWYEEERSRILYTCEEKYDGNMVAYVIDLETTIRYIQTELCGYKQDCQRLIQIVHDVVGCPECIHEEKPINNPICKDCGILGKNWVWRGIQEQKGGDSL